MSRFKICVAALIVSVAAVFVPSHAAAADTVELAIAGSSGIWQTAALGTFQWTGSGNTGNCAGLGVTVVKPCYHYTNNTVKFNLNDTRPTNIGGSTNTDTGNLWIVWDSAASRHVWVYINVDSVVGDRCFFAQPHCTITVPGGYSWSTTGGQISSTLWGADTVPPSDVTALFGPGISVSVAATDIRPDDAQFVICRVNSTLGSGTVASSSPDGLDGLGYAVNPPGTCPAYQVSLSSGVGTQIQSGLDTATANPLAFNISGHDPFTNTAIPASYVINFGADPVVFVFSRTSTANSGNGLKGAADASDAELQNIFSGTNCNASELAGTTGSDPINAFLREPLSGTMNTTEASVFRRPVDTVGKKILGLSQETGVGSTNPLKNTACAGGGGSRTRGIGTGEVIKLVKAAGGAGNDGIAYTFFSFGNVSSIGNSASYGYLTLDGQDVLGLSSLFANQELPTCTFPCPESSFAPWIDTATKTLQSFPALRSGKYTAWSLLRMVTNSTHEVLVEDLAKATFTHVVNETPDYIPAEKTVDSSGNTDPGLIWWHTHYQQVNGNGVNLGGAPTNGTFPANHNPSLVAGDHGGDMGGCTITTTGITATTKLKYIQADVVEPYVATCALDR